MYIGIKYCGGCNPKFDRAALVERIKKELEGSCNFEYAKSESIYDAVLVVCGCTSCCARHEDIGARYGKFFIMSDKDYSPILQKLKALW